MRLNIKAYESHDFQLGKLSRTTYNNFPEAKRPILSTEDVFYIGDLVRPTITIQVLNDDSLENNTIYLHESAIQEYYTNRTFITIEE